MTEPERSLRYPFVLLDVGETLIGPRGSWAAVYAGALAELGRDYPLPALERGIRETQAALARRIPPGVDRFSFFPDGEAGFWSRFVRESLERTSGARVDEPLLEALLERLRDAFVRREAWRVYADVRPALDALREAGARLAVVSNWDSNLPRVLAALELDGYFETLAVSHLEGVEKPDPELFRRALERLGARPEQALHAGNLPDLDVAGARAAGIDAVLVDRTGSAAATARAIADLSPLPDLAREGRLAGQARRDVTFP